MATAHETTSRPAAALAGLAFASILATAPGAAAQEAGARAAGSGEADLPDFQGLWATDCQAPDTESGWFVVMLGDHVLVGGADFARFTRPAASYLGRRDVAVARADETTLRVVQERQGQERYEVTLAPCAGLPELWHGLHGEAVGLLKHVPALREACEGSRAACLTAVLDELDLAGTGGVNEADLARVVRVAGYVGVAGQEDGPAQADDLALARGITEGIGAPIANKIVRGHDYTADGQITREDLEAQQSKVLDAASFSEAAEQVPAAGDMLQQGLSKLLSNLLGGGL